MTLFIAGVLLSSVALLCGYIIGLSHIRRHYSKLKACTCDFDSHALLKGIGDGKVVIHYSSGAARDKHLGLDVLKGWWDKDKSSRKQGH